MTPPDHKLSQVCVCVGIKGEDKESAHLRSCSFSSTPSFWMSGLPTERLPDQKAQLIS